MGQPISLSLAGATGICTSLCQLLKLKTSSPRNCGASTFHHGKWKWKLVTQSCPTLCDPMEPTRLLCPWNSPGKNSGVGCHFLLQGIFPTQGSNPGHHIAKDYLPTEPPGKPWRSLPLWRKWQTQGIWVWKYDHDKAMTNLDSVLEIRDIMLLTKACIVKAMIFLVFMYGCDSWTIKKAECLRTDAFEL